MPSLIACRDDDVNFGSPSLWRFFAWLSGSVAWLSGLLTGTGTRCILDVHIHVATNESNLSQFSVIY